MLKTIIFAVVLLSSPDEVRTKDGKEYKNLTLVRETATHYHFVDLDGRKLSIAKDEVESYEKKPTVRDELKAKLKAASATDAAALWELAKWAREQGLAKDAREVAQLVIKADAEHAEARDALGFVKVDGGWLTKKDAEAKIVAKQGEVLKKLGFRLEGGKWVSPAELARKKAKLVAEHDGIWVTQEQKQAIEAKNLAFREGEWLTEEEVAKFDAGERKIKGVFKPMVDADEEHRDAKNPWSLSGAYVEVRSTTRHAKILPAYKAADAATRAAVALSGIEPDIWGGKGPLLVVVERDIDVYKAQGERARSNWGALRSSSDGVFFAADAAKGSPGAVTYYHDDNYMSWWGGRGAYEAYVARVVPDIEKLDDVLLDAFGAYFASFVTTLTGEQKYHPANSASFLFVASNAMRPASKMFEGFARMQTDLQFRQMGFLIHFLAKKNPEGLKQAFVGFLAGNVRHRDLIKTVLGPVDPAELDAEYLAAWEKFRSNFTP